MSIDYEIEQLIKLLEPDYTVCGNPARFNEVGYYMKRRRMKKQEKQQAELVKCNNEKKKRKTSSLKIRQDRTMKYAESGLVGTTDNTSGIQLISRLVTSERGAETYSGQHDMSDATIKETTWDLDRMIERPLLVGSWKWETTSVSPLATLDVPLDIIKNVSMTLVPFQHFRYWRGDITFKLQVIGTPLLSGILGMSFIPLSPIEEVKRMSGDLTSLTLNPTVFAFANANTNAELKIPFNSYYSYIDPMLGLSRFEKSIGHLIIYVIDPLKVASSVEKVSVSLFATFTDNEFKVPRLASAADQLGREMYRTRQKHMRLVAESGVLNRILDPIMENLGSTVQAQVDESGNLSRTQVIDAVSTRAMPSNFIGDALDVAGGFLNGVLSVFGLDAPTIPTMGDRHIMKCVEPMNYCVGPSFIDKMNVNPSSLPLVTPETFSTLTDEMSLDYLYRKYTYFRQFKISTADESSAIVDSWQLHPQAALTNTLGQALRAVGETKPAIPLIGYLGLPFKYWTGGLAYKFIVSASMMHTCKLFVSFQYGENRRPTTLFDVSSQYGVVIEISQGSNEFEFIVPYVNNVPYLLTSNGVLGTGYSMGTLNVTILNPLVAPSSVADNISVFVFAAGADDFRYEWLTYWNPMIPVSTFTPVTRESNERDEMIEMCHNEGNLETFGSKYNTDRLYAESGMIAEQTIAPTNIDDVSLDEVDTNLPQIAPPQMPIGVDEHFGLVTNSLRDYGKKYQFYKSFILEDVPGLPGVGMTLITIADAISIAMSADASMKPILYSRGYMAWLAGMYRQYRGSLRFKIVGPIMSNLQAVFQPGLFKGIRPRDASVALALGPTLEAYTTIGDTIIAAPRTNTLTSIAAGGSNVLEFEVPYTMPYLSCRTTYIGSAKECVDESYIAVYVMKSNISAFEAISVFVALGDETRFGTLYRVPDLYVPGIWTGKDLKAVSNTGYGEFQVPT